MFRTTEKPELSKMEWVYEDTEKGYYYYGYCIELIYKISDLLNFEFTLKEPADGSYGTMQPDGSWNGIVKELMDEVGSFLVGRKDTSLEIYSIGKITINTLKKIAT